MIPFSLYNAALDCAHAGCTLSAFTHHELQIYMLIANKDSHQRPHNTVRKHYSQESGAIMLRMTRQRKCFKAKLSKAAHMKDTPVSTTN